MRSKRGVVKFFSGEKGYGFIAQDDGGPDLHVHKNRVIGGGLLDGDYVIYDESSDAEGKVKACNVSGGTGRCTWGKQSTHERRVAVRKYLSARAPLHDALDDYASKNIVSDILEQYPGAARGLDHLDRLPLHHALENGSALGIVIVLLNAYPDAAREKDYHNMLPLHNALLAGASDHITTHLLEQYPEGARETNDEEMLPVHIALENGASESIALALLKQYPDASRKQDSESRFPLQLAVEGDASRKVVQALFAIYPIAAWADGSIVKFPPDNVPEQVMSGRLILDLLYNDFVGTLPKPALRGVAAFLVGNWIDDVYCLGDQAGDAVPPQAHCVEHAKPEGDVLDTSMSDVVQEIIHDEPAAIRDEELLEHQADEEWATNIEQLLHGTAASQLGADQIPEETPANQVIMAIGQCALQSDNEIGHDMEAAEGLSKKEMSVGASEASEDTKESCFVEKVHVLRFGCAPSAGGDWKCFEDALLYGPHLSSCIHALQENDFPCKLPSGALVLVPPSQYSITCKALAGMELHPYHVVISENFEYLVEEILQALPFRKRPKIKPMPRGRQEVHGSEVDMKDCEEPGADIATNDEFGSKPCIFVEARSFLNILPLLRDARSVAQSTTEAVAEQSTSHYHSFRGYNPRRFA